MPKTQQFDDSPITVTISKRRDVAWLRALVSLGEYESLNDAVADLVEDARSHDRGVLLSVVDRDDLPHTANAIGVRGQK